MVVGTSISSHGLIPWRAGILAISGFDFFRALATAERHGGNEFELIFRWKSRAVRWDHVVGLRVETVDFGMWVLSLCVVDL